MDALLELIKTRRNIRNFKSDLIPDEIINKLIEAALYAPNTRNHQTRMILAVKGIDNINKITDLMRNATINAKNDYERVYIDRALNPNYSVNFKYAPLFIVALAANAGNPEADVACMLENMFLLAHSYGIGSVWVNQLKYISDTKEIREFLDRYNVPKDYKIYGCAAFGYNAATHPAPAPRKDGQFVIIEHI